jgi:hypothetical protein
MALLSFFGSAQVNFKMLRRETFSNPTTENFAPAQDSYRSSLPRRHLSYVEDRDDVKDPTSYGDGHGEG